MCTSEKQFSKTTRVNLFSNGFIFLGCKFYKIKILRIFYFGDYFKNNFLKNFILIFISF